MRKEGKRRCTVYRTPLLLHAFVYLSDKDIMQDYMKKINVIEVYITFVEHNINHRIRLDLDMKMSTILTSSQDMIGVTFFYIVNKNDHCIRKNLMRNF